jgi:hypothetical protein
MLGGIVYRIVVYAGQGKGKKKQYWSCITPQAYDAVKESGETITGDSPVMRDLWQTTNVRRGGRGNITRGLATNPRFLKSKGIKTLLDRVLWKRGIRTTTAKRHEFKAVHGFREFFMTHTEQAGMNSINVKILMGHSVGVEDHYYRPRERFILQDYLKAVPSQTESEKLAQSRIKEIQEAETQRERRQKDKELGWRKISGRCKRT